MIEKDDDKDYAYLAAHLTTGEALKNILNALRDQGVEAIILKGIYLASAVYEDLARQPGSDIDLALDDGQKIPWSTITKMLLDIDETTIPMPVDLIDLHNVANDFKKQVLKEGIEWTN